MARKKGNDMEAENNSDSLPPSIESSAGASFEPVQSSLTRTRRKPNPAAFVLVSIVLAAMVVGVGHVAGLWGDSSQAQDHTARAAADEIVFDAPAAAVTPPLPVVVEKSVAPVVATPTPVASAPNPEMMARLDALEKQVQQATSGVVQMNTLMARLDVLEDQLRTVQQTLASSSRSEPKAAALSAADAAVLTEVKEFMARAKQQSAVQNNMSKAMADLESALATSAPFRSALARFTAAAKGQAAMLDAIKPLDPYADDGVRTLTQLQGDFKEVVTDVRRHMPAAPVAQGDSLMDTAKNALSDVVQVRRVGEAPAVAAEPDALTRAADSLKEGNLSRAVEELSALSVKSKKLDGWLYMARQRLSVMQALETLKATASP